MQSRAATPFATGALASNTMAEWHSSLVFQYETHDLRLLNDYETTVRDASGWAPLTGQDHKREAESVRLLRPLVRMRNASLRVLASSIGQ